MTIPPTDLIISGGLTTAESRDQRLRDALDAVVQRASHTGTQAISTVAGLQAALDDKVASIHTHPSADISDSTAAGRAILTGANAEAQRASLDLGTAATASATDFATAAALAAHIATKGASDGFAGLDGSGRVPLAQLAIVDHATAEAGTSTGLMSAERTTSHFNARVGPWVRSSNLLASVSGEEFLVTLGGSIDLELKSEIRSGDDKVRALAALADERGQEAAASSTLNAEQIEIILERLRALETQQETEQMTTYALDHTADTTASVLVGSADVTRLQVVNRSEATIGIAYGDSPASVTAGGVIPLPPGAAIDTDAIPATPIYVIASAVGAELAGAFSVPRNAPNPNFEAGFATILAGMGSVPSFEWETAYRRLYSALRRDGILAKARGLFIPHSHSAGAGAQNWAVPGTVMTAVGSPSWTIGSGFIYNGVDQYHNTDLTMNGFTTTTNSGAVVWPDTTAQGIGKAAMGDGSVLIEANRTATTAAVRTATTTADAVSIPGLGSMLGYSRVSSARATVFRPGGRHATVVRNSTSTFPTGRTMVIGATNSSTGINSFYTGSIRAAYFGRALDPQQILAFETAMDSYFLAASESIEAGA